MKRRKAAGVPHPDSLGSDSTSTLPANSRATTQQDATPVKRTSRKPVLRNCTPRSKDVVERAKLVFFSLLSTKNAFPDKDQAEEFHAKAMKFVKKGAPPDLRISTLAKNPTLVCSISIPLKAWLHA